MRFSVWNPIKNERGGGSSLTYQEVGNGGGVRLAPDGIGGVDVQSQPSLKGSTPPASRASHLLCT